MHQSATLTSGIIKRLEEWNVPKNSAIYCDNAEPDRIEEIFRAGFRGVKPAKKDVQAGIDFVKRFKILSIGENSATNKDFRGYKWREDKNGVLLDEPAHMFSHAPDAVRYAVYTHLAVPGMFDERDLS